MKIFVMYGRDGSIRGAAMCSLEGGGVGSPAGHDIHVFDHDDIEGDEERTRFLYDLQKNFRVAGSPPALARIEAC